MRIPFHLTFSDPTGKSATKGPFPAFCLQGETLREEPNGPVVAVHEDHHWQLDGKKFTRFDCDCNVLIRLSRVDGKKIAKHGPYKSFSAQDGVTFANHELFAFADRSIGDWYCHADGLHWAILIVEGTDEV